MIGARVIAAIALTLAAVATSRAVAKSSAPGPAEDSLTIPCALPETAVKSLPVPLDRYVELVCTHAGQALKPLRGENWVFNSGATWLSATNPKKPLETDHYVGIVSDPMRPVELTALREELAKLRPEPTVLTRDMLRFSVTTSWGATKQIYLIVPPPGAGPNVRTLGMECTTGCRPIERDPWFFVIVPADAKAAPNP